MRSRVEREAIERVVEEGNAEQKKDPEVMSYRETIRDEEKGFGKGWNSKGRAFLRNYDAINWRGT